MLIKKREILFGVFLLITLNFSFAIQSVEAEYYIVSVSPDETMVAGAGHDGRMMLWDSLTGLELFRVGVDLSPLGSAYVGFVGMIPPLSIAWHPNSRYLATVGGGAIIYIWCTDRSASPECIPGSLVREIEGREDILVTVAWNTDGRLVSSGEMGSFSIWNACADYQLQESASLTVQWIDFHPVLDRLALAKRGAGIYLISGNLELDPTSTSLTDQRLGPNVSTLSVEWNSDGSRLAFGTEAYDAVTGDVYLMNPVSSEPLAIYHHTFSIYDLAWSPDDRNLAVAEADGKITVWDTLTGISQVIPNIKYEAANLQIDWTETTGLIFANDKGIVGLGPNASPIANAGIDQTLIDEDMNGSQIVHLSAVGSHDDVVIVDYVWHENGVQIASGIAPQISLEVGTHTITLTVTDDDSATHTDQVIITVELPTLTNQ